MPGWVVWGQAVALAGLVAALEERSLAGESLAPEDVGAQHRVGERWARADLRAEKSAETAAPFREVAVAPVLVALAASRAETQAKTAMVSVAAMHAGTVSTAAKALALVFACRRHIHAPGSYAVPMMPDTRCTPATAS